VKRPLAAVLIAVSVVLVSSCSSIQAGSAATSTVGNVTESDLTAQVQEALTAQGENADAPNVGLTIKTLNRLILTGLVGELASRMGISISQGQIDSQLATYEAQNGGQKAVADAFATNGIPPSQIPTVIRINLQAAAIAKSLLPNGTQDEQNAALTKALSALSQEVQVQVSPRFGTWDPAQIMVGAPSFDLSAPPKGLRTA
jgi:hypothetical protein